MSKRANGAGSVYQRADGRWAAAITIAGKRVVRYAHTKREAMVKLRELKAEQVSVPSPRTPTVNVPASPVFASFAHEWLRSADVRPVTRESYRRMLDTHIIPVLGAMQLLAISPPDVARVITAVRAKGLSDRTVQYAYVLTRHILQVAADWGLIPANPATRIKRPRVERKQRRLWTVDQAAAFVRHCTKGSGPWDHLFLVAILSGLRLGELLGLQWSDVDLERGILRVERSLVELKPGDFRIQAPRSRASIRTVALPAPALAALRRHREAADGAFVFRRRDSGEPPTRSSLRSAFRATCRRAGVPYITIHGLRHQHVSLLAHAGVPVKVAQERVGHSTPVLTLSIYTHVLGDADRRSAEALDGLLGS